MTPSNAALPLPWYRHRWPWLLLLGPALVVLAGIHTAFIAFTTSDALVVDDYYKEGKAINQDLRRDHAASSLQLAANVSYDAARGRLAGRITQHGLPVAEALRISLIHPTQPEKDMRLEVLPDAEGNFSAPVPMLERARWQVQVENARRSWRLATGWSWPQQVRVTIQADPA